MTFCNAGSTIKRKSWTEALKSSSPGEGGFDEGDVPVDFGAVPEGFNVGGVDCHGVDQRANPDSVTGWREKQDSVGLFV